MRRKYIPPKFEFDDFKLIDVVCANVYNDQVGASPEFYSVGGTENGVSPVPIVTVTGPNEDP